MASELPAGLLEQISAAVTPVAMISSAAIIIGGINTKHQSMSDRLRTLATEFRHADTSDERKSDICRQMEIFNKRIKYSANAHRLLYLAISAFTFTVLLIILSPSGVKWTPAAYILFVVGVALMLVAVVFEFVELMWTNRTLRIEMEDVLCLTSSVSTGSAKGRVRLG